MVDTIEYVIRSRAKKMPAGSLCYHTELSQSDLNQEEKIPIREVREHILQINMERKDYSSD